MSCACHLSSDTLHYASPAHGGWGVVRIGMLVPESYQLFVCPFACGRHGAIGALNQGFKDRLSYLYVDQADIIEGYDTIIMENVPVLLDMLPEPPKALLIFVSCLDDLIGTDCESLQLELAEKYPHIDFQFCHMNPISLESKSPPMVTIQRNIYNLLRPREERGKQVNSIGNLDVVDPDNEINHLLGHHGYRFRHISQATTYEEFQDMALAEYNFVLSPPGLFAAKEMEQRLGIPHELLLVSYRLEEIGRQYETIRLRLSLDDSFSLEAYRQEALETIASTRKIVGDMPIIVSSSATFRPYMLARALLEYGFNVRRLMVQKCIPLEEPDRDWLKENFPDMEILPPLHHDMVNRPFALPESLALGSEGAYIASSRYPVDIAQDEGAFGYRGICSLMERMRYAVQNPVALKTLIEAQGLVV